MKGILKEIRQQPPHIRELFMWVCVVITFSIVGFAWFRSTTRQFVALLNPPELEESRTLAQTEKNHPSPFATLFSAVKDLGANIGELFDLTGKPGGGFEIKGRIISEPPAPLAPQKLPLSGNKE